MTNYTPNTENDECEGCGSTASERPTNAKLLRVCPHCDADKCIMCDMGDDVNCGSCPDE